MKRLSILIGFAAVKLVIVTSADARALPILNESAPTNGALTLYPDHMNPDLYYFSPQSLTVATDASGIPKFSYMEYQKSLGNRQAIVQVILRGFFEEPFFGQELDTFRRIHPQAILAPMPLLSSRVELPDGLRALVEQSSCTHIGGSVESDQQCLFVLNTQGTRVMRGMFAHGVTVTLTFLYQVIGVIRHADGTFSDHIAEFGIAGRIGGLELAHHPELFRQSDGKSIQPIFNL